MTVEVHYTQHGEERVESFDSEQAAGVFIDGIGHRSGHKFLKVRYPDAEGNESWY